MGLTTPGQDTFHTATRTLNIYSITLHCTVPYPLTYSTQKICDMHHNHHVKSMNKHYVKNHDSCRGG